MKKIMKIFVMLLVVTMLSLITVSASAYPGSQVARSCLKNGTNRAKSTK